MSVANERFRQGDVFIDYDFEDVLFRYDAGSRRFSESSTVNRRNPKFRMTIDC